MGNDICGYQYYKSSLNKMECQAYDSMAKGFYQYCESVSLMDSTNLDYEKIFSSVLNDNPLIFHVKDCSTIRTNGRLELRPKYLRSKSEYFAICEKIKKSIYDTSKIIKGKNEWNTLVNLHSYILSSIKYRDDGYDSHTVVSPALNKTGVCQGISRYVKLICDSLGIGCVCVSGTALQSYTNMRGNHEWNIIKLGNCWYYFDFTFDLTINESNPCNIDCFDYFAILKKEIEIDHFASRINLPDNSVSRDYFSELKMVVSNFCDLEKLLINIQGVDLIFKVRNWRNFDLNKSLDFIINKNEKLNRFKNMSREYIWDEKMNTYYVHFK